MVGVGVPARGVLEQQAHDDRVELGRDAQGALRGGDRDRADVLEDEIGGGARERRLADDHLVEHAAHRVEIGLAGERRSTRLLGGHVLRGPEDRAAGRQADLAGHLREAEVEQLDEVAPVGALEQEDVVGFDVAVDDVELVRAGERGRHLHRDVHRARLGHRAPRDHVGEADAVEELHHQVDVPVVGLPVVGDVDDVLVIDPVGGLGLTQEAPAVGLLERELLAEELDRHVAPDHLVACAIDRAHAARADALDDHVATADGSADERVGQVVERARVQRTHGWLAPPLGAADGADLHSSPASGANIAGLRPARRVLSARP